MTAASQWLWSAARAAARISVNGQTRQLVARLPLAAATGDPVEAGTSAATTVNALRTGTENAPITFCVLELYQPVVQSAAETARAFVPVSPIQPALSDPCF